MLVEPDLLWGLQKQWQVDLAQFENQRPGLVKRRLATEKQKHALVNPDAAKMSLEHLLELYERPIQQYTKTVQTRVLSTYLGRRNVSGTYWYVTTCPELMGTAIKRFERRWEEAR